MENIKQLKIENDSVSSPALQAVFIRRCVPQVDDLRL
jgi:hypothetical protein